jgi:hypothetical protein
MKYFCTLSDYNYLPKGIVLYESLIKTSSEDFRLFYLCLDDKSFIKLNNAKNTKIIPINLSDLEGQREELRIAKSNRPYNQYCWTLASYFCNYILEEHKTDHITYIDADILFYADIDIVYREIGIKSVGIIAHRHNKIGDPDGAYNVGIIYFKNDKVGKETLFWWKDAVINKKYPHLQTCGDQKYLEEFIPRFGEENICVADKTFAHAAPWNYRLYYWSKFKLNGKITWNNEEQILVFTHFSRMSYDVENFYFDFTSGFYADHTYNGTIFRNIPQLLSMYNDYFLKLVEVEKKLKEVEIEKKANELKIAFGMIILNGDYVLKQCLESIYPYASQIMIAEGPVAFWQRHGITTSTDKTNEILHSFPDPENKISIVHGQYSEKDEQCQAYMKFMKPDTDYLFMIDSDETYKSKDIETIIDLLKKEKYTSVSVRSCSFYGPFQRYMTGFEEQKDQFMRIFKVCPGSYWKTHRPPTMAHVQENILPEKHLDSDTLFNNYGVRMYHYSYVFPRQILNKMKYYQTLAPGKFIDSYFENMYYPWVIGDDAKKLEIENKYSGVHEYKPEYRNPAFTAIFNSEHPDPIKRDMNILQTEWNNQLEQYINKEKFALIDSWKNKQLLEKQLSLNLEELKNMFQFVPFHIGDFLHFVERFKNEEYRLMDIGCGCGVYSEICKYYAPWIKYEGIDYAKEAIDIARKYWSGITFRQKDYKELTPEDFKNIEILHACSLHNVLPEGKECMNFLLSLNTRFIIFGKILTTSKPNYYTIYKAYDEFDTYMYFHNYTELCESFKNHNYDIIEEIKHGDNSNFLLRKNDV